MERKEIREIFIQKKNKLPASLAVAVSPVQVSRRFSPPPGAFLQSQISEKPHNLKNIK